jgi:glycosyltransferase involved in cell wall biosynthesis
MNLPDYLTQYRSHFIKRGVPYPLPEIPWQKEGLLAVLPAPPEGRTGWPWTEQTDPQMYNHRQYWPKLTIVGPSYNQGSYLEETIRSVLLQNYPNLEYIVIDGGSDDHSKQIIEKYAPWINYWHSEKDRCHAHALNLGFSLASGSYYAWLNSDDTYVKDVFHLVINTFIRHKTDFVYGYGYNSIPGLPLELVTVPPLLDYFIKIPNLVQPSCFWRASINEPVWEEMLMALDYELWLRMVKGHKRKRIRKPLSVAKIHVEAKTHNPKIQARWNDDNVKMWAPEAHGPVPEWKRIVFLNRIRMKFYKLTGLL